MVNITVLRQTETVFLKKYARITYLVVPKYEDVQNCVWFLKIGNRK